MSDDEARPSKKARRRRPAEGSCLTAFALRLAKQLSERDGRGKNLVFSPLSIYAALALLAAGARGETLDELLALLGASSRDELDEFVRGATERALADHSGSGGPLVAFACGVWHEQTMALKPAYRAAAVESYKAETRAANFLGEPDIAREEINRWVSNATNKLIPTILPKGSVHGATVLVLANAIYFKGKWFHPFDKEETKKKRFYCADGRRVRVPFMSSDNWQFVDEYDGFRVLKLPYQMQRDSSKSPVIRAYGGNRWDGADECHYEMSNECPNPDERPRLSMCIFLPDDRDGLSSLIDEMSSSPSFLRDHIPVRRTMVGEFRLPKFKLSLSGKMNDVLKAMGLEAAFDQFKADLSDMLEGGDGGLYLENVFHEAVIEVNEEGTEAAASSACTMVKKCAGPTPVDFVADHPFAFFVVEEVSGAVIFMGYVVDPAKSL